MLFFLTVIILSAILAFIVGFTVEYISILPMKKEKYKEVPLICKKCKNLKWVKESSPFAYRGCRDSFDPYTFACKLFIKEEEYTYNCSHHYGEYINNGDGSVSPIYENYFKTDTILTVMKRLSKIIKNNKCDYFEK